MRKLIVGIMFLAMSHSCYSKTIVSINPTVIDKNTEYKNTTIDLSNGSFIIVNNAVLKIENSKINGNISRESQSLIKVTNGNLILKNNTFNINTDNITSNPGYPALYYALNVIQGGVDIEGNTFNFSKSYTAGLLTTSRFATSGFKITGNRIRNAHGGLLLRSSNHASIVSNNFINVSSSNIFIIDSSDNLIKRNTILFSGNNNIGDGMDVSDSTNIIIRDNLISSGSCYSLMVLRGNNIVIDHNKIISGITYAIFVGSSIGLNETYNKFMSNLMGSYSSRIGVNNNITVTNNYLSQNRYGLAVNNVDGLTVKNNIFIQHFSNSSSRKFWTNNDVLFQNTANVVWEKNIYKEAYSQDQDGENKYSGKFVTFPLHGGVVL